jgi:hypothetical protein
VDKKKTKKTKDPLDVTDLMVVAEKIKTDDVIQVQEKILIIEQKLMNLETGLKLALSRLGLQKEYKNGE